MGWGVVAWGPSPQVVLVDERRAVGREHRNHREHASAPLYDRAEAHDEGEDEERDRKRRLR